MDATLPESHDSIFIPHAILPESYIAPNSSTPASVSPLAISNRCSTFAWRCCLFPLAELLTDDEPEPVAIRLAIRVIMVAEPDLQTALDITEAPASQDPAGTG